MTLREWLDRQGRQSGAATRLSRRTGLGIDKISKYSNGKRFPTPRAIRLIWEATEGEVSPNDWFGPPPAFAAPGPAPNGAAGPRLEAA